MAADTSVHLMRRLLVANRGEIAVRIIRTAKELGIETVAVVSEADTDSLAATVADRSIVIGPAPAGLSYLRHEAVIRAATEADCDAVHPGYGFLSEDAGFARAVLAAGLVWVGPDPESIELMGDKSRARAAAVAAGVPTLVGTAGEVDEDADLDALTADIGFPLAVKASAGGGGRGIRIVDDPATLANTIAVARAEAQAAFGWPGVYLERFVRKARHVEVQIVGDGEQCIHIGDRDCSMQRRQQKVIEEAPAPSIDPTVLATMRSSAVALAQNVGYRGAGTVEFLYDDERHEIAFLEMNTRLQVEHPVTELVSGLDLVREQLRIASGARLSLSQADVRIDGHAIELRVSAENPAAGFLPSPGTISRMDLPGGPGVRNDFGYGAGGTVPPFYDSLVGKIVVWAPDRPAAIARARRALDETHIEGIDTTVSLLKMLLSTDEFAAVTHSTRSVEAMLDRMGDDT